VCETATASCDRPAAAKWTAARSAPPLSTCGPCCPLHTHLLGACPAAGLASLGLEGQAVALDRRLIASTNQTRVLQAFAGSGGVSRERGVCVRASSARAHRSTHTHTPHERASYTSGWSAQQRQGGQLDARGRIAELPQLAAAELDDRPSHVELAPAWCPAALPQARCFRTALSDGPCPPDTRTHARAPPL
jgi:hypothetical protein